MGEAIEWSVASTRLPNGAKAQKQIQLNRAGVFRNYLARLLVARTVLGYVLTNKKKGSMWRNKDIPSAGKLFYSHSVVVHVFVQPPKAAICDVISRRVNQSCPRQ